MRIFLKRKRKNSGEMSYNEPAYRQAYNDWKWQQPEFDNPLPKYFTSSIEPRAGLFMTGGYGHLLARPTSESTEDYFGVTNLTGWIYELARFMSDNTCKQAGVILRGYGNYYTNSTDYIQNSVLYIREESSVLVVWENHKNTPVQTIEQHYSYENIRELHDLLVVYRDALKVYDKQKAEWALQMPQTWQFPPLREEETDE